MAWLAYLLSGVGTIGVIVVGGVALFVLTFGSWVNHIGRGEQDDDET